MADRRGKRKRKSDEKFLILFNKEEGMKKQIIVKGGCGHSSREMAESGAALGLCVLGGFGLIIGTVAIVALAAIFKG